MESPWIMFKNTLPQSGLCVGSNVIKSEILLMWAPRLMGGALTRDSLSHPQRLVRVPCLRWRFAEAIQYGAMRTYELDMVAWQRMSPQGSAYWSG